MNKCVTLLSRRPSAFIPAPLQPLVFGERRAHAVVCTQTRMVSSSGKVELAVLPQLRTLSAATRRGREATAEERAEAERFAAQLENVPQSAPLLPPQISLLNGEWHLLFLVSGNARKISSLQSRTINAADNDPNSRNVTQTIDVGALRVENAAAFKFLGVRIKVSVDAELTPMPDNETVEVRFRKVYFKIGPLPTIGFPIWFFRPRGTLRTTYLSDSCRIGRGDKGTLFILVREP